MVHVCRGVRAVEMKPWKQFEKLAEQIYGELSPDATVKWNDHIQGVDSQTARQIDVSIRWTLEGQDRLVIVQVKNWNHKADVKAVGEFSSVIQDVRANGGILVCKSGFTNNALRYGRNIGIRLHNLHDAQKLEMKQNSALR